LTEEQLQQDARIKFRCRRGMLELDSKLQEFYASRYHQLDSDQKNNFEELLEETDPDLYRWLIGMEEPSAEPFKSLVKQIRG